MNLFKLTFAFVRRKPLTWAFHVLTLSLGVGVVVAVVLLSQALDQRFQRDLAGVDLVVGAKGSPLQLIMSALFAIDMGRRGRWKRAPRRRRGKVRYPGF